MKNLLRIALSLTALLGQTHAEAQSICEGLFTPSKSESKLGSAAPATRRLVQTLNQQKKLILGLKDSLDPSVVDNYVQYLEAYSQHLGNPSPSDLRISSSNLLQREARLQKELESMQQAADEIRAIRYPKDEINEKVAERRSFTQGLQEIEGLWRKHMQIVDRKKISEQTLKRSRTDGKGSANATRTLSMLSRESADLIHTLNSTLDRLSLSEFEKSELRSFFSAHPLDAIITSIFSNSSAIHLSNGVRSELAIASTKDSAIAIYLDHLQGRHTSRLDREIEVTLASYSAVAYKYYERLFLWGRNNRFKRHSDILDLGLRARLVRLDSELEKKQTDFESDLRTLENIWNRRSVLLSEARSLEQQIDSGAGADASLNDGRDVLQLGEKFRELQAAESRIASFFPMWKTQDRFSMFVGEKLTRETLAVSLKNEIESLKAAQAEAYREREGWLARHKETNNAQDDIELF